MEGFFQKYFGLYRPLITKLNELLGSFGLSYSLWQVIFYLKKMGPATLVAISSHYQVEKPAITRRVHRLVELGLIQQIPGRDRREKVIQLTEQGEAVYHECRLKITALEHNLLEGFPEDDRQALFRILPELTRLVQHSEGVEE